MARIIVEGSATLSSEHVFNMSNAQALLSAEIFVSDSAGSPPGGLTTAQRNQWLIDRMKEKLVVYLKSETRRLSKAKRDAARDTADEAEIAIETNY